MREHFDANQPLFIWWGQFGFKFHKKVGDSTLGEDGAATCRASAQKKLSEGEPPRHAWDACGTAAQTLLGWRGDVNRYDLLCRCRAVFRIPVRAVKHG